MLQEASLVPGCVAVFHCSLFRKNRLGFLGFLFLASAKKNNMRETRGKMKRHFSSSASSSPPEAKIHNKSQRSDLSFLLRSDEEIGVLLQGINDDTTKSHEGLLEGSPCKILHARDGRISSSSKKVAYGYQLIAFKKFGRSALSAIPAAKSQNDTTISHLCGTRNCCEPTHLFLETKQINDERTHCHFCITKAKQKNGWAGVRSFFASGACPHSPQCCSLVE